MPIIKSAKKKMRQDKTKKASNSITTKKYKEAIKKTKSSAVKSVGKALGAAFAAIDKAAKKNVIHRNKANRLKSRLAKSVSKS